MNNRTTAIFGPAGTCLAAAASGVKSTEKLLDYLASRGVTAFEYQCGRGVNIGQAKAELIGSKARELGIELSLHAPYYISLASAEAEKRDNSIKYILDSARAADWMGATRIVVHPGGLGKLSRAEAAELASHTLERAVKAVRAEGLNTIICPEVMGKINQLGDLGEVLGFCAIEPEGMLPCVDFGHLNSRMHGEMSYPDTLDEIFASLGEERAKLMHIHFSKIEYSKGGEVRHLTFGDERYGPDPAPLMEELARRGMTPTVICESDGTQTDDALEMQELYRSYSSR
ncbi:MAG: endonuclease IV [Ruminococcaceae bacterium]|nr:endonuclease IV [Oscillospiraceae bacterium]